MRIKRTLNAQRSNRSTRPNEKEIRELFEKFVVPSYARFDLVSSAAREVTFGMSMAAVISILAAASPFARSDTPTRRSPRRSSSSRRSSCTFPISIIMSRRAAGQTMVELIGPGRCFFCNSGAEANEGLFKLARKFGHDEGRYEIITAVDSFHGRTLAGIAATGQEKVKKGFEPMVAGIQARAFQRSGCHARGDHRTTAAILIEAIQGESGITVATPEYLRGFAKALRRAQFALALR